MPRPRMNFSNVISKNWIATVPNSPSPHPTRADTRLGRAWQMVTSFVSLAARSLPAAGV